jgi:flagellar biosynthesis chaperone FliJ
MFSTLFYLFLLFYDGLFAKSSEEYNAQITQLNKQIATHQYKKALHNAESIQKLSLFTNPEIEHLIAVLKLKTHQHTNQTKLILIKDQSINNDILYSYYMALNGNSKEGYADLHRSIIQNGNVDTLVKAFELYTINFPQNKLKKQSNSAQMISQSQKINTQEALSLLDLMKKKQKNLIY